MFILILKITVLSSYIDGDLLEDDGSFSFEIAPPEWMRDRGQIELTDAFVMDNAGNTSAYSLSPYIFCFNFENSWKLPGTNGIVFIQV